MHKQPGDKMRGFVASRGGKVRAIDVRAGLIERQQCEDREDGDQAASQDLSPPTTLAAMDTGAREA